MKLTRKKINSNLISLNALDYDNIEISIIKLENKLSANFVFLKKAHFYFS